MNLTGVNLTLLTFIIPVRHQDNARNWGALREKIAQTAASISRQTHPDWRAVVVANEGADLPDLPPKFSVERVTFSPNLNHERPKNMKREAFWDAFRWDKGRRVLAGMLAARDSRYFMIVDDDDFVSSRIVKHLAENPQANGWHVHHGYLWDEGGGFLFTTEELDRLCGTTLIIRSDLYGLPERFEDATVEWIKTMLGSHRFIAGLLAERGTPLSILPFRGAVYRVASAESHSGTPSFTKKYGLTREKLKKEPMTVLRTATRLRLIGGRAQREFNLPRLGLKKSLQQLKAIT